ncbi:helix-turn-helix transcriptional regulator [Weissella confusa]|uniref:helix-turn-helix domain-containing protein n=1 Tax=Weissella confusa TaxID=1583 RepID=UPI0018F20FCC|nr:helix-turn-helix transcriptional regulator [Weissella confusa]MBJ7680612.1 helix-turn-helix transcriptional regulator [Weissella confusa]
MTLFERIKETAKERGISLTALSVESGLGEKTIYKWKEKEPSASRIKAVADTLGVSVDYLLGNTDEMHGNKKDDKSEIDLDKALADQGVVMRYQGKELSDKAKRGILEILKLVDGDED